MWPINTKVIQTYLTIKMSQYSQHIQQSKTAFVKPRTESKSLPCFYMKKVHIMHCFYFLCSNYPLPPYSVQSVAQSCPTLCDPMKHSTPGLPVHHQLPEPTQTHVHWVGDAIQPSHPLSSPSPPAFNLSQHHIFSNESALRISSVQFSSVQLLSRVRIFATPWITACQGSLSITNSQSLPKPCPSSWWCHQPSHPVSSPSPPAPNPSQHYHLFQWVNSSHEVAKVLEFQLQHQSFQWTPRANLL